MKNIVKQQYKNNNMKNNIKISICPMFQQKEEKKESSKEFIVKVDDVIGDYLESLLNVVDKYNKRGVNFYKADRIEYGDYILFTKNDVRVLDKSICPFQFGKSIYSLVDSYYTVIDKVKSLYKKEESYKECPYYKAAQQNNLEKEINNIILDIVTIDTLFGGKPKKESYCSKVRKCFKKCA